MKNLRQPIGSEDSVFGFLLYAKRISNSRIISALVLFKTCSTYHSQAIKILRDTIFKISVGDPDPHVFEPPGTDPDPLVRGTNPAPAPDPYLFLINVLSGLK